MQYKITRWCIVSCLCCRQLQFNKHKKTGWPKDDTSQSNEDQEKEEEEAPFSSELDGEESSHFDQLLNMNKPKGLVDGLSKFFMPSNKRKSRVSLSSIDFDAVVKVQAQLASTVPESECKSSSGVQSTMTKSTSVVKSATKSSPVKTAATNSTDKDTSAKPVSKNKSPSKSKTQSNSSGSSKSGAKPNCDHDKQTEKEKQTERGKQTVKNRADCDRLETAGKSVESRTSQSQQAASRLVKRCKQQVQRGRKKTEGPPGTTQLNSLNDGLSHLFTAQGERKRTFPIYNPSARKRRRKVPDEVVAQQTSTLASSIPNGVCRAPAVTEPQASSVLSVLPTRENDSDWDADREDEGEEEEVRCFTGVKVRPAGSGKGSEGRASTDSSDSEEEEEGTSASQAGGTSSSRLGPGQTSLQGAAQDEGKIPVSLASCGCLVVG